MECSILCVTTGFTIESKHGLAGLAAELPFCMQQMHSAHEGLFTLHERTLQKMKLLVIADQVQMMPLKTAIAAVDTHGRRTQNFCDFFLVMVLLLQPIRIDLEGKGSVFTVMPQKLTFLEQL